MVGLGAVSERAAVMKCRQRKSEDGIKGRGS
jgi:hypothetical protein